jgi:hypothetical protein
MAYDLLYWIAVILLPISIKNFEAAAKSIIADFKNIEKKSMILQTGGYQ